MTRLHQTCTNLDLLTIVHYAIIDDVEIHLLGSVYLEYSKPGALLGLHQPALLVHNITHLIAPHDVDARFGRININLLQPYQRGELKVRTGDFTIEGRVQDKWCVAR